MAFAVESTISVKRTVARTRFASSRADASSLPQELFDRAQQQIRVSGEHRVIPARELDVPGARDVLGEIPGAVDDVRGVAAAVHHQRRNVHRREHPTDVDLPVHAMQVGGGTRARTSSNHRRERLTVGVGAARMQVRRDLDGMPGRPPRPCVLFDVSIVVLLTRPQG
jgi:hypothetical protein